MGRVLVACEFSGTVRDACRTAGHEAGACDLLPTEVDGPHYQGDVRDIIGWGWDLMVAHPPCTYLATMGIWWNHKRPERWTQTYAAMEFVNTLWNVPISRVCLENPIGYLNRHWMRPSQIIHPYHFGHQASKPTCIWLRGLPPLMSTLITSSGEFYQKKNGIRIAKWSHRLSGTSKNRARVASRTFPNIAAAMADQWGPLL